MNSLKEEEKKDYILRPGLAVYTTGPGFSNSHYVKHFP